ncbi:MAG: L,D-transpeptidase family protein, partial [Rhodospirillales bacterium]|nr:L,D-transpeptidase family protein [Rhodospirillales bacterium]
MLDLACLRRSAPSRVFAPPRRRRLAALALALALLLVAVGLCRGAPADAAGPTPLIPQAQQAPASTQAPASPAPPSFEASLAPPTAPSHLPTTAQGEVGDGSGDGDADALDETPQPPPLKGDIVGEMRDYYTWTSDTLLDIARGEELGLINLMSANPGVDPWLPGKGTHLILPTAHILPDAPRTGIVINVAELRLYLFEPNGGVWTFPIGVGRDGFSTPLGRTKVVRKKEGPTWIPTAAKRAEDPEVPAVVPPGPDNP